MRSCIRKKLGCDTLMRTRMVEMGLASRLERGRARDDLERVPAGATGGRVMGRGHRARERERILR